MVVDDGSSSSISSKLKTSVASFNYHICKQDKPK